MHAANPASLSVGGYFAAPAERARAPWSQPPVQAAELFMTVLPPHGQLAKEYSSSTHRGPTLGQQTCSAKLGNEKSTSTYCHQHSSKEGRHRSKNRQGHNLTHTQTLRVACPRSKGAIRTGTPRTTRGQTLGPAGTQGQRRLSTTQKQDSRARSRSYPRHCHRAAHLRPRASGGNGRDKGT